MKVQILAEMESKRVKSLEETKRIIADKKAALLDEARKEIYGVIYPVFPAYLKENARESVITESIDEAWSHISKTQ